MSIPVKINNTQILSFDIVTDDITITNLGKVSEDTKPLGIPSLCVTADCYDCTQTQCNEVQCHQTQCNQVHCGQVKCNNIQCIQIRCTEVRCGHDVPKCNCRDDHCSTDN